MPHYNLQAPRATRQDRQAQQQETDLRQQELDQRGQAGMMSQLQQLYNISNNEQVTPAHIAQMEAQTRGANATAGKQEFENDWAQPNAIANYEKEMAGTQYMKAHSDEMDRSRLNMVTPQDVIKYHMATGKDILDEMPPEYHQYFPPEMVAAHNARKATADTQRQAAITADQAQQSTQPQTPHHYDASSIGSTIGDSIMDMPASVYNAVGSVADTGADFLGLPPQLHSARLVPYSARRAAQKKGTDYGSAFYNPRDPSTQFPLPVANK